MKEEINVEMTEGVTCEKVIQQGIATQDRNVVIAQESTVIIYVRSSTKGERKEGLVDQDQDPISTIDQDHYLGTQDIGRTVTTEEDHRREEKVP